MLGVVNMVRRIMYIWTGHHWLTKNFAQVGSLLAYGLGHINSNLYSYQVSPEQLRTTSKFQYSDIPIDHISVLWFAYCCILCYYLVSLQLCPGL